MRFRKEELSFKMTVEYDETFVKNRTIIKYPKMSKTLGSFKLNTDSVRLLHNSHYTFNIKNNSSNKIKFKTNKNDK